MKDGVLIINKQKDMTSHDVVAKARRILQTKKIGHTGTLDPMATGVLVLCVGAATKLVQYLTCEEKIYEAEMKLGLQTDTGDITGKIIHTMSVPEISEETLQKVLTSFIGKQTQIPPMYSAIKKDGVKLYELARKGLEITRDPREIEIFAISLLSFEKDTIRFCVRCSKGTYIRVLCEDIAKRLNCIGTMTNLNRVQTGQFTISKAIAIDEISEEKILSMENLFDKKIVIEKDIEKLLNGMLLAYNLPDGLYNLYTDHYIGIGKIIDKQLKREIIL